MAKTEKQSWGKLFFGDIIAGLVLISLLWGGVFYTSTTGAFDSFGGSKPDFTYLGKLWLGILLLFYVAAFFFTKNYAKTGVLLLRLLQIFIFFTTLPVILIGEFFSSLESFLDINFTAFSTLLSLILSAVFYMALFKHAWNQTWPRTTILILYALCSFYAIYTIYRYIYDLFGISSGPLILPAI